MKISIDPVDPQQLIYAYQVGALAGTGRIPQSGVGGMEINLREDDGSLNRIELTDTFSNRAMIAVRDQFPDQFKALAFRIMAMSDVSNDRRLKPYIRPVADAPGESELHEAVFHVAAEMPLNPQGSFYPAKFAQAVAAKAAELDAITGD